MRRALALVLALLACTCVPPTDDRDPRGAAGVRTAPSEATRGTPFVTDDGWTVTIDALYLRTQVLAFGEVGADDDDDAATGGFEQYLWDAREPQELWAPGVAEGQATVRLELSPGYVPAEVQSAAPNELLRGIPDAILRRFTTPEDADSGPLEAGFDTSSPAVVLVATGEKSGRKVVLDVGFATSSAGGGVDADDPRVDVVRDDVRFTSLRIEGEHLFALGGDGIRRFQPFADAEAAQKVRSGRVTGRDLVAVRLPCLLPDGGVPRPDEPVEERCARSVLDLLRIRAPAVIGRATFEGTSDPRFGTDDEDFPQVPEANP